MDTHIVVSLLSLLLVANHVTSFTIISNDQEQAADLADVLQVLQRQRRHGGRGYLGNEHLLDDNAPNVEAVLDWLRAPVTDDRDSKLGFDTVWDSGRPFTDFESDLQHVVRSENSPLLPAFVKLPGFERENIFERIRILGEDRSGMKVISENTINNIKVDDDKGDKTVVQKKSNLHEELKVDENHRGENDLSFNSLTKEELKALMKALGHLWDQSAKLGEKTMGTLQDKVTVIDKEENKEIQNSETIIQSDNNNDLKKLLDRVESPVAKETKVMVAKTPRSTGESVTEKQILQIASPAEAKTTRNSELDVNSEIDSDLRDSVAGEAEKYISEILKQEVLDLSSDVRNENEWIMEKTQKGKSLLKRNNKRAGSLFPELITDRLVDDVSDDEIDRDFILPPIEKFVAKIMMLQDEVRRLKMVSQLEGLENDILTDALNEATLGQEEGTVSGLEFESLQQALKIEEALKNLKRSEMSKQGSDGVIGPDGTWRRKRGSDFGSEKVTGGDSSSSYTLTRLPTLDQRFTKGDLQSLLGQTYLMKD